MSAALDTDILDVELVTDPIAEDPPQPDETETGHCSCGMQG